MQSLRSLFSKSKLHRDASFQILSDLHLEVGQQYADFQIPVSAPYLILAGDIGRLVDYTSYLSFLATQCSNFELVFLVLGNHEFYGSSHEKGVEAAKKLELEPSLKGKLVLLDRKRFVLPGSDVTVLGCSLWSEIDEEARDAVAARVNDFRKIDDWSVQSHNAAYETDIAWLRGEVEALQQKKKKKNRSVLVVTHHAPCIQGTSEPRFDGSAWNSAFATDLLTEAGDWKGVVKTWVYGHTHYSTEFSRNGVKIISNQRGYVLPGSSGKLPDGCGKGKWKVFDVRKVVKI